LTIGIWHILLIQRYSAVLEYADRGNPLLLPRAVSERAAFGATPQADALSRIVGSAARACPRSKHQASDFTLAANLADESWAFALLPVFRSVGMKQMVIRVPRVEISSGASWTNGDGDSHKPLGQKFAPRHKKGSGLIALASMVGVVTTANLAK
jgi:hypothetical protein